MSAQSAEARLRAVEEIITWVVKDVQDTFHCSYDADCLRKVVSGAVALFPPHLALPMGLHFRNGVQDCDILFGPCACGAWHTPEDLQFRVTNQLAIAATPDTPSEETYGRENEDFKQRLESALMCLETANQLARTGKESKQYQSPVYHAIDELRRQLAERTAPSPDTKRLAKGIMVALYNCIAEHGPITSDYVPSAAKRIYAAMNAAPPLPTEENAA